MGWCFFASRKGCIGTFSGGDGTLKGKQEWDASRRRHAGEDSAKAAAIHKETGERRLRILPGRPESLETLE